MSQLPPMPQLPAGVNLIQSPETVNSSQLPQLIEPLQIKGFQNTLHEFMEAMGSDAVPLLNWHTTLPIDQAITSLPLQIGRFMPLREKIDGNMLPPVVNNTIPQDPLMALSTDDSPGATELSGRQPKVSLESLVPKIEAGDFSAFSKTTDNLLATLEEGSHTQLISRYAVSQPQSMLGNPVAKSAMTLFSVNVPVGQADWGNSLAERIQWMVGQHIQQAEVKLTPPHLGPMEIRISVQNEQASVNFIAAQAPTREAIEAALPRLKEMFGEINLNLTDVDINQQDSSADTADNMGGTGSEMDQQMDSAQASVKDGVVNARRSGTMGLVDDYA